MTRPPSEDEEEQQQHVSVQWDGSDFGWPDPDDEPEPEPDFRPPLLQRYKYWLYAFGVLLAVTLGGYVIGEVTYNPGSRLPTLVFSTDDPFYGTNPSVAAEIDAVRQTFSGTDALELDPVDGVFYLPLPRTVADRLFGERDESITVFTASGPTGDFRFLLLSGGDERQFYIEAPMGLSRRDRPSGVYVALDAEDETLGPLVDALEALMPAVDDQPSVEVSPDNYYAFGPYQAADAAQLEARIEASRVMTHLVEAIDAADGGVSVAAPMLLLGAGPSRGTINAVYHPARQAIMEPLWGASSTDSLAHELVHAYIDTVIENEDEMLSQAADYLERAHPVLHGEVVSDLYQRLDREGRAEESLAFIAGAIAAGQTKTVSTQRLLENTGNLQISEAILYSDVDLLVQYGILPPCMLPNEGARGELQASYYDLVEKTCQ